MEEHAEERARETAPEAVIFRAFPGSAVGTAVGTGGGFLLPLVIGAHMFPYAPPVFPEAGRLVPGGLFLGLLLLAFNRLFLVELGNLRPGRKGIVAFLFCGKVRNRRLSPGRGFFPHRRGRSLLTGRRRCAFHTPVGGRKLFLLRQGKMKHAGTARTRHLIFFAGPDGGIGHIAPEPAGRTVNNHGNLTASSLFPL